MIYIKAMETYYVTCEKNTANKNSSVRKTKQNRLILLSNSTVFSKKKTIKNQKVHQKTSRLVKNQGLH